MSNWYVGATWLVLLLAGCGSVPSQDQNADAERGPRASDAFNALAASMGRFRQETSNGFYEVEYASIARGTAIVETWTHSNGRREMTVFFRDGAELKATHYCNAGVQSTMRLTRSNDDSFVFDIVSATNLPTPQTAHNSGFAYRFARDGDIERRETWTENGTVSEEWSKLERQRP